MCFRGGVRDFSGRSAERWARKPVQRTTRAQKVPNKLARRLGDKMSAINFQNKKQFIWEWVFFLTTLREIGNLQIHKPASNLLAFL